MSVKHLVVADSNGERAYLKLFSACARRREIRLAPIFPDKFKAGMFAGRASMLIMRTFKVIELGAESATPAG
jgi:hypothetical protein